MKIILGEQFSHIGVVRETNEDAVYLDITCGLLIVADGIGGQSSGEVASAAAVDTLVTKVRESSESNPLDVLREGFYEANHKINTINQSENIKPGMGTTMTAALIDEEKICLCHVGDSRAYLISKAEIRRLTEDHSLAGELLKDGSITKEEAANHPQRNVLTRSLGQHSLVKTDEVVIPWMRGDYLLICSDGLYNLLEDRELQELIYKYQTIRKAVDKMIETALQRGGYDNISVVIAYHE